MTTRKRLIPLSRSFGRGKNRPWGQHWTRKEQIQNAKEDGTITEIRPPLTREEQEAL